jgi:hypothetical protein
MDIYNTIIHNIIRTDDNWFDYNYKPSNNIPYILKIYFSMLEHGKVYKSRQLFFYEQFKNQLISSYRDEFEYLFNKIQRHYYILVRFVNMCKYKKANIIVNTDLQLNEINEKDRFVISILHCGKKYLFKVQEIIKHINTLLTNSPGFFASPKQIKNPYNGTPFTKSTLYNIYFYVIFNTNMQIEIFHKFFLNHFNINLFEIDNEPMIREYAIRDYINNSTTTVLSEHILNMLDEFNLDCEYNRSQNRIIIDRNFPKNKLVKIMKPYLKLYFSSLYSLNIVKQRYCRNLLYKKLILFNTYNIRFGMRIVKAERVVPEKIGDPVKINIVHCFSEEHIKYCNIKIENFMKNHLNNPFPETNNVVQTNNLSSNTNDIPPVVYSIVNNLDDLGRLLDTIVSSTQEDIDGTYNTSNIDTSEDTLNDNIDDDIDDDIENDINIENDDDSYSDINSSDLESELTYIDETDSIS